MADIVQQVAILQNKAAEIYGPHPSDKAKLPGRTGHYPAISPEGGQNLVQKLAPSLKAAVDAGSGGLFGGDTFSETLNALRAMPPEKVVELRAGADPHRQHKVRAVIGWFEANIASGALSKPPFNIVVSDPFLRTEQFQGRTILAAENTVMFWEGLRQAALHANALSAEVTFSEKLLAAKEGALEGLKNVGDFFGETVNVTTRTIGETSRAFFTGLFEGLGPVGIATVVAVIYFGFIRK